MYSCFTITQGRKTTNTFYADFETNIFIPSSLNLKRNNHTIFFDNICLSYPFIRAISLTIFSIIPLTRKWTFTSNQGFHLEICQYISILFSLQYPTLQFSQYPRLRAPKLQYLVLNGFINRDIKMFVSSLNVLRYLITTSLDNQMSIIRDLQLANPLTNYEEMHSII